MSIENNITRKIHRRELFKFWGAIGATAVVALAIPTSIDQARVAADERALAALAKSAESKKNHQDKESEATIKTGIAIGIISIGFAALYKLGRIFERDASTPVLIGEFAREDFCDPHPPSTLLEHVTSVGNPRFTPPGAKYRLHATYSPDIVGRQN